MKYLMCYESFEQDVPVNLEDLQNKTSDYLQSLSLSDMERLKSELDKFAHQNNLNVEDLEDPEVVKQLLMQSTNEGVVDWLKNNWYSLVDKLSKYTKIFSAIAFIGSLIGYYGFGADTLTGVKVAAAAYIISNIVTALKGLK
jgi:hypothetical protein